MIVKIGSGGKSFKGLAEYLTHDPKARTEERVDWTHTCNLANDDVKSAVNEILWTARNAELLKQEAGIRAGGRATENPVKEVSLNWSPEDQPTREHITHHRPAPIENEPTLGLSPATASTVESPTPTDHVEDHLDDKPNQRAGDDGTPGNLVSMMVRTSSDVEPRCRDRRATAFGGCLRMRSTVGFVSSATHHKPCAMRCIVAWRGASRRGHCRMALGRVVTSEARCRWRRRRRSRRWSRRPCRAGR